MENQTTGKLALALSKAQGAIKTAKKDNENPYFKSRYADLASVWEACRQALSANELAVIQAPEIRDGILGIKTKLMHSSGEFEESFLPIAAPMTAKAQEMGSAITYARRYALSAMVGIAPDDDDDGNQAQQTGGQRVNKSTPKKPSSKPNRVVDTIDQLLTAGKLANAETFLGKLAGDWTDEDIDKIEAARKQKKTKDDLDPAWEKSVKLEADKKKQTVLVTGEQVDRIEALLKIKMLTFADLGITNPMKLSYADAEKMIKELSE